MIRASETGPGMGPYLDKLAAALDGTAFTTCLVTGPGEPPELKVASMRFADSAKTIRCDGERYLWSSGRPIAAVSDVQAAAQAVTFVLRAGR